MIRYFDEFVKLKSAAFSSNGWSTVCFRWIKDLKALVFPAARFSIDMQDLKDLKRDQFQIGDGLSETLSADDGDEVAMRSATHS